MGQLFGSFLITGRRDVCLTQFLQVVINGISIGSAYVLVGLGLTAIYNVYKIINMAHGEFYMVGAFIAYGAIKMLNLNFFAALILTMIATALLGALAERVVFRPLEGRSDNDKLVMSIGLMFFVRNIMQFFLTANSRYIRSPFGATATVEVGGIRISIHRIMVIVFACVLVFILQYFYFGTKLGRQMRSVSQRRDTAQLMGINVKFIGMLSFMIGCALAAFAGAILGSLQTVHTNMGMNALTISLVSIVLGGLGSNIGAIAGGLLIGVLQAAGIYYISPLFTDAIVYSIMLIVLVVKPTGLFGG